MAEAMPDFTSGPTGAAQSLGDALADAVARMVSPFTWNGGVYLIGSDEYEEHRPQAIYKGPVTPTTDPDHG